MQLRLTLDGGFSLSLACNHAVQGMIYDMLPEDMSAALHSDSGIS